MHLLIGALVILNPSLPIVDIHSGTSPIDDPSIAQQLDMALQKHGFCYISGHNIATDIVKTAFDATHRFHALAAPAKQDIKINPFHRGYIGFNTSTAVTSSVEKPFRPNYSESFMAMQPVFPDHARWGTAIFGPNQWPESLMPAFKTEVEDYYEAMQYLALELVQRLAVALGQDPLIFDQVFDDPTVFLRLLHYPAVADSTTAGGYGSAPHTDHGFLTLVSQDLTGGLEVLTRDSQWIPAVPIPDTFVLNVADMLSYWSGGRWPSTPHRVSLSAKERYSVAFFFDPTFETQVRPFPSLTRPGDNDSPVHYGNYLMHRFNSNYDYRSTR